MAEVTNRECGNTDWGIGVRPCRRPYGHPSMYKDGIGHSIWADGTDPNTRQEKQMADSILNDKYDRIEVRSGVPGVIVLDGGSLGAIHYFMDSDQESFSSYVLRDLDRTLIVARLRFIADALDGGK